MNFNFDLVSKLKYFSILLVASWTKILQYLVSKQLYCRELIPNIGGQKQTRSKLLMSVVNYEWLLYQHPIATCLFQQVSSYICIDSDLQLYINEFNKKKLKK